MSATKYTTIIIEVRGRGLSSILDMLRYDNCVPATEEESGKLERLTYGGGQPETIKLRMFVPVGGRKEPTKDRWKSFGWEVVSVDARTVR